MRLVIARCSVDYAGRLTAHLPLATRLLIVKADGSVLVHSDGGSYKPLNWMSPPCRLTEEPGRWIVTGKSGETLTIELEEIISDSSYRPGPSIPAWSRTASSRTCRSCWPHSCRCSVTAGGWSGASSRLPSARST